MSFQACPARCRRPRRHPQRPFSPTGILGPGHNTCMSCILALDVGDKTIGTAVSDELHQAAFARTTLQRQPRGYRADMRAIRELVENIGACEVVVGWALNMDDTRGPRAILCEEFAARLRRFLKVPVILHDERLTTFAAHETLASAGMLGRARRRVIDSVAAQEILERYLAHKRESEGCVDGT